jgi:hypothetical protein
VFDDSKGLVGLAPTTIENSIIEGIVPSEELIPTNYEKKRKEDQDKKNNLPDNMNNPFQMFSYMVKTLMNKINPDSDSSDSPLSLTTTFVIVGSVFCLMNFFIIYCSIQYFRF